MVLLITVAAFFIKINSFFNENIHKSIIFIKPREMHSIYTPKGSNFSLSKYPNPAYFQNIEKSDIPLTGKWSKVRLGPSFVGCPPGHCS